MNHLIRLGKPTHLQRRGTWTACGVQVLESNKSGLMTTNVDDVNCLRCRDTVMYRGLKNGKKRKDEGSA